MFQVLLHDMNAKASGFKDSSIGTGTEAIGPEAKLQDTRRERLCHMVTGCFTQLGSFRSFPLGFLLITIPKEDRFRGLETPNWGTNQQPTQMRVE